jgi:glycosyltransferase involved in cell wall biosynthesis
MKKASLLLMIPNLGRGGAQQVFRDQLQFYSRHFNTIGCVFNMDDSFKDDKSSNIISLDIPAGRNTISKIICFFKRVAGIRRIKKQYNVNFSISHLEGADYVNILSKRKEKTICWIHGTKAFDENIQGTLGMIRKKVLIPLTYRLSDKIVTVSEGIRTELINIFKIPASKINTIYNNFILEDIFTKAAQDLSPPVQELFTNRPVVITHCRLSKQKNLFALLDIFTALKPQEKASLVILGDGELREELLMHCSFNNLKTYSVWSAEQQFNSDYDVYFLGYERNPYPFLHRADLYVMTSSWEGFPLSLCEAMACEIPVISADCYTGPREIISPGLSAAQPVTKPVAAPFGVLMPLANKENNETWRDTILSLLRDDSRRHLFAKAGKQRVFEFDRKKISTQWLNLIERLDS